MANQITDPPINSNFGHDFNYSVWTPGTRVTMANVPWTSDYRDIVQFEDGHDGLDKYLFSQSGPIVDFRGLTYAKYGHPVKIDLPFNIAAQYNYLRVDNPAQPLSVRKDGVHRYYYFIQEVRYVAPNTTELLISLDAWQTFGYNMKLGNCYIERGHIGIANSNSFEDYGRSYLTIPEGLDIGGEYQIVQRKSRELAQAYSGNPDYRVLLMSTVSLMDDPGTVDNPHLTSATGSNAANLPNGCEFYLFNTPVEFKAYMEFMKDKPWITQGILSVTVVPSNASGFNIPGQPVNLSASGVQAWRVLGGDSVSFPVAALQGWRDALLSTFGRYQHLKKFLTYPYCVVEITAYTGTPIIVKPESWQDSDATVVEMGHFVPPGARIALYPFRYNATSGVMSENDTDVRGVRNDGGEFLDMATGIFNFPMFSIVNNSYLGYLASNTHGIAFQHQSADWSQQKALTGNQLGYDQSTMAAQTSQSQTNLGIQTANAQTTLANNTAAMNTGVNMLHTTANAAGNLVGGGGVGSVASAGLGIAGDMASLAINNANRSQATAISNNAAQASNNYAVNQSLYNRDTNKQMADWAAKGDYQNTIAGINAKIQDARLTQPSTSGQLGGDAFNLAKHRMGYDVKVKMLSKGAMRAVGEYWLRYGYAVQQFGRIPDSLLVCEKFSYWKLRETYIAHAVMPEMFKQTIRGIFEKGVTVWRNPWDIGTIDLADNAPIDGVVL